MTNTMKFGHRLEFLNQDGALMGNLQWDSIHIGKRFTCDIELTGDVDKSSHLTRVIYYVSDLKQPAIAYSINWWDYKSEDAPGGHTRVEDNGASGGAVIEEVSIKLFDERQLRIFSKNRAAPGEVPNLCVFRVDFFKERLHFKAGPNKCPECRIGECWFDKNNHVKTREHLETRTERPRSHHAKKKKSGATKAGSSTDDSESERAESPVDTRAEISMSPPSVGGRGGDNTDESRAQAHLMEMAAFLQHMQSSGAATTHNTLFTDLFADAGQPAPVQTQQPVAMEVATTADSSILHQPAHLFELSSPAKQTQFHHMEQQQLQQLNTPPHQNSLFYEFNNYDANVARQMNQQETQPTTPRGKRTLLFASTKETAGLQNCKRERVV